ncbi:hypothetical protein GGR52DRAFT_572974 [Hypoxylon sp. FL1284]|nr:hypothetical protein GGR52DRAFT_572974 [Hypoxylon sp. FL1284]
MPISPSDPEDDAFSSSPAGGGDGCFSPFTGLTRPVEVADAGSGNLFWALPILGPLLVMNESSDTRDHCANERSDCFFTAGGKTTTNQRAAKPTAFLSYLRLSIYMAIVAVAIVASFHLKSQPSPLELRMAQPLGIIFWLLSLTCLVLGFCNYIKTLNQYSRKVAMVQSGLKTHAIMSLIALAIIGTCIILLVIAKVDTNSD